MSKAAASTSASAVNRTNSLASTIVPPYTANDPAHLDVELASLDASGRVSPSSAAGEDAPPPAYTTGSAFVPTVHLQIQTPGKSWLSFPTPLRPDPIPVYAVSPATGALDPEPAYTSYRHKRGSGNCFLVAGAASRPLSTTTYRFGPNRPARVSLYDPIADGADPNEGTWGSSSAPSPSGGDDGASAHSAEDNNEADDEAASWDAFALTPKGLLTRAVTFKTRLGSFEWRYASRAERKAAYGGGNDPASSLLVLDRVTRVFTSSGKEEESRTPVAHFVRSGELRSPGSGPSTAGNGGRLLLDLRAWDEGAKTDRKMVEVLAVTTAVSMLKKEVDRRRAHQIAIMSGAGSGGP